MERTLSVVVGQGSLSHNSREFLAENIDRSRVADNICYVHEKLEDVYLKTFEESRLQYNAKQKRKDRQIENYMEHVRMQKDKNLFYEVVVQVGDHADMNAKSEDGKLAEKILDQYMKSFTERNPTLYVFSAHLHMDESTPHLHIDYVPFTNGHKRSLETQTTLKGALAKLGFTGGTRGNTEQTQWQDAEKEKLAEIMFEYGITWVKKDEKREHLSVLNYKKEMRTQEVAELEHVVKEKQAQVEKIQKVVCKEKSDLKDIQAKKIKLKKVEQVAVEKPIFNANKFLVDKSEFEDIKSLAQKQVVVEKRENELINTNKKLTLEVHHLKQENALQQQELPNLNQ